jgi:hypothetical protein
MSFRKWQKLMAAKTPNAVALDLLMEETPVAGFTPVWLDTFSSLAELSHRLNGSSLIQ